MICPLNPHLQNPWSLSHVDSCLGGTRQDYPHQLSWGGRKNSEGEGPGSLANMCVTFLASVPSDSDTIQISTEGKGGINETLHSLPVSVSVVQILSAFLFAHSM